LSGPRREEGGEILEGALACGGGHGFPIRRGIPRLLCGNAYALYEKTQENFSFSWRRFSDIYKDPRDFLDWIRPRTPDFFRDKVVCDAGCGSGKHALFAADFGARDVIAFDLSPAVDVAFARTRGRPNIHVVQADIYHLPFRADFDFVYCIGVLQHLPDAAGGFRALARLLKRGGAISVWVYGYEGTPFVRGVVDPLRKVVSRLPLGPVFVLTLIPAGAFYLLSRLIYRPLSARPPTGRLSRALPMSAYFAYMSQFDFTYVFNSVFDQLIAPITHYFRRDEVEEWFRSAGLDRVFLSQRNAMSWRATGERP
jgi:SAM-dependent methyltransferase